MKIVSASIYFIMGGLLNIKEMFFRINYKHSQSCLSSKNEIVSLTPLLMADLISLANTPTTNLAIYHLELTVAQML